MRRRKSKYKDDVGKARVERKGIERGREVERQKESKRRRERVMRGGVGKRGRAAALLDKRLIVLPYAL